MLNGLVPINQSFGSCIQLLKDFCYRYSRHVITKTGIFGNGLIPKNIFSPQNYHFVIKKREKENIIGKFVNSCAILNKSTHL